MNKEEQIALELTKLSNPSSIGGVWGNFEWFVNKLTGIRKEENDTMKLVDEIETYKYILKSIKKIMEHDENNFVLKEDLEKFFRGIEND